MLKLFNTLTKKVEEFQPLNNKKVSIYTCGPTVYDYPHIGNWYSFLRWDLLVRVLIASGYKPKWVMNITDVGHLVSDGDEGEDKFEKGARREGKNAWEIANFYNDYFVKKLDRMNFLKPDYLPRATDYIDEQIEFIKGLETKGFTYKTSDGIYFDTSKINNYGKLARLDIKNLKEGARVEPNPEKRNPTDFALWKFSPTDKKRDMEWDSPWGKGFPGWHLECSTLSLKFLGESIDIHGGGIDHIAVHHTNEIAQSESLTGKPMAKYWMHTNFVQVSGQKMSKSLGNFITLEDIEAKGFSLEAFRLFVYESHYRSEAQFNWAAMQAAQNRLNNYYAAAVLIWQTKDLPSLDKESYDITPILKALQNDLNSAKALSILSSKFDVFSDKLLPDCDKDIFKQMLEKIDALFGFELAKIADITPEQKALIAERETARAAKDWAKSDEIRDSLKEQGITLRDTSQGPIWQRTI